MQREIKFRVWHKPEKKMHFYLKVKFGKSTNITLEGKFKDVDQITTKTVPNDHLEIMQFTGLLDQNGKEIYEGDITRCGQEEKIGVVEWHKEFAMFTNCAVADPNKCEVIGNIYENPELIKQ